MKRYTSTKTDLIRVAADAVKVNPDGTFSGEAINQLSKCEDFLALIAQERQAVIAEMDRLRARNQTKSVRFRELFISKLVYANLYAQLAHCGLSDETVEP
jgi:hypothetical protein